jgi:hypothetical protein
MKEAFKNGGIEKMIIVNGSSMNFLPGGLTGK